MYGWLADSIAPLEGYYDVKAHGLYDSVKIFNTPINAKTLSRILISRDDYEYGKPVRLLCCYTGDLTDGRCFAQDLANYLNTEVIAPDFELIASSSGELSREIIVTDSDGREYIERIKVNEKDFRTFKP